MSKQQPFPNPSIYLDVTFPTIPIFLNVIIFQWPRGPDDTTHNTWTTCKGWNHKEHQDTPGATAEVTAYEPVVTASWTGWLWSSLKPKMLHPNLLFTAETRHIHPSQRLMTVLLKGAIQYYLRPPKRADSADVWNERMKLTNFPCGRTINLQNSKLTLQYIEYIELHRKFMERYLVRRVNNRCLVRGPILYWERCDGNFQLYRVRV